MLASLAKDYLNYSCMEYYSGEKLKAYSRETMLTLHMIQPCADNYDSGILFIRAELTRICAEKSAFFIMKTVFELSRLSAQFAS